MNYTKEDLAKLDEAIVKLQNGDRVAQVAHDGHVVKYSPVELSELLNLRKQMKLEIKNKSKRRIQIITSKGVN